MKTLLISGVCGFVGSSLALRFRETYPSSDLKIIGFDNLSRPGAWTNIDRLKQADVQFHHADVRSVTDLSAISDFDWVIDAAANPSVLAGTAGQSSSRVLMETNLVGTINLLEMCKRQQAGMILLSTSRVYCLEDLCSLSLEVDDNAFVYAAKQAIAPEMKLSDVSTKGVSKKGVDESFSTRPPVSLYGASKLASEQLAIEYSLAFDFPVWINRCGVLAGAGQFGKPDQGVFAFWIHSWREQKPLRYIGFEGSGFQVRDCLHPHDLFRLIDRQLNRREQDCQRIVNASGGIDSARSLKQLSRWCEDRWGKHPTLTSSDDQRPFDVPWMVLDSTLAESVWDWRAEISPDSIFDEIASFAESHPDWLELSAG